MNQGTLRLLFVTNTLVVIVAFFWNISKFNTSMGWVALLIILVIGTTFFWLAIRITLWIYDGFSLSPDDSNITFSRIMGIILLVPGIFSVYAFIEWFIFDEDNALFSEWEGFDGAMASTSLPLYFGIMAIAGVLLLKRR